MDVAPSPKPSPVSPAAAAPAVVTAWPRSAQLAAAFLLGAAAALLAPQTCASSRGGARPPERVPVLTYRVDLNQAGRAELLQLPGVGDSLADRIESHRREHGPFRSVEDLTQVHGIGPATLE